jgi:hypothetical protein
MKTHFLSPKRNGRTPLAFAYGSALRSVETLTREGS